MAKNNNIPQHIKNKVLEELGKEMPYSMIAEKWGVSKATVSRINAENVKQNGIEPNKLPISNNEKNRRAKIGKSAVTLSAIRKADFITENFLDAFGVIFYNSNHLVEVIDHSKTEADALKIKQEEILKNFEEFIDIEPESDKKSSAKLDLLIAIKQSIQKIDDFYNRDMIRIKAVSEMRKQLETFLKMKQEIMDIQAIKNILDAFFNACSELEDSDYIRFRDKVISLAPVTKDFFIKYEALVTNEVIGIGK